MRRGPKPTLTREQIVEAATAVADQGGLGVLSMRAVAERLGAATMSLYTYVGGKAQLLDLMAETAAGEALPPVDVDAGWRTRLELIAREHQALVELHPWLLELPVGDRPQDLQPVADLDLTEVEKRSVLALVTGHAETAARAGSAGEHAFEFGLQRILDGIEALLTERSWRERVRR